MIDDAAPQAPINVVVVRGFVDGRPCVARWSAGRLQADPEVLRRAEIVVALGEQFGDHAHGASITASLEDGSAAAVLTLIRAFTIVTGVDLSVHEPDELAELADTPPGLDAVPQLDTR